MSSGDSPDARAAALGYAIKRAQHALRLRMDLCLRPLGITTPQYSVLSTIRANPGLSNAQLARRAFVTPQTMQAILAGLEREGLLVREPDPDHGRVLRSILSAKGEELLGDAHQIVNEVARILLDSTGDQESQALTQALNAAADALSTSKRQPSQRPIKSG